MPVDSPDFTRQVTVFDAPVFVFNQSGDLSGSAVEFDFDTSLCSSVDVFCLVDTTSGSGVEAVVLSWGEGDQSAGSDVVTMFGSGGPPSLSAGTWFTVPARGSSLNVALWPDSDAVDYVLIVTGSRRTSNFRVTPGATATAQACLVNVVNLSVAHSASVNYYFGPVASAIQVNVHSSGTAKVAVNAFAQDTNNTPEIVQVPVWALDDASVRTVSPVMYMSGMCAEATVTNMATGAITLYMGVMAVG